MSRLRSGVSAEESRVYDEAETRANNRANNGEENTPIVAPQGEPMPDDLRRVVERWADLPEPVRMAVLALVRSAVE